MNRAPTIGEQTGWTRPHPLGLCQDFDLRQKVTQTDFDLEDPGFQRYAKARGVLYLAGKGLRWQLVKDHSVTRDEYLTAAHWEPLRWWVDAKTGKRLRLQNHDELETSWRIVRAAKGALQDAWELYQVEQNTPH